jgi:hypothetical protein
VALPPIYKIHPAIGIARLGDAATFFIGPETPGLRPIGDAPGTKVPPYKDGGKIKRQAARFRVYEYVDKGGKYVVNREVPGTGGNKLVWTVELANRKASFFKFGGMKGEDRNPDDRRNNHFAGDRRDLEIRPGPRTISGANAKEVEFRKGSGGGTWPNPAPNPSIETLGTLLTDSDGRLIVLGGHGDAGKRAGAADISGYANNDGWFDDVSDGPVTAQLLLGGKAVNVAPAWVICPPPDFAPHLTSVVTLYDLLFDLAARKIALPANEAAYAPGGALASLATINAEFRAAGKFSLSSYKPDFMQEIYPILDRAAASMFLAKQAIGHHSLLMLWSVMSSTAAADKPMREAVLEQVRKPDAKATDKKRYMPKLLGDEPYPLPGGGNHQHIRLTVTPTQYALLEQWAKGAFAPPSSSQVFPPPPPASTITPEGLDRAALENCVGGAFYPGIEVGWQIRQPSIFAEPFRIKDVIPGVKSPYRGDSGPIRAGHFTRQMALPWQADFLQCKTEDATGGTFNGTTGWGWWPAQRPDFVFPTEADFRAPLPHPVAWHRATSGAAEVPWPHGFVDPNTHPPPPPDTKVPSYTEMLDNWRKFGFIIETAAHVFVESERETTIP